MKDKVILTPAVNARDAMPDGGHLAIATANADLDELGAEHAREHSGAPLTQVFEPFFTTKGPGKGTGYTVLAAHGPGQALELARAHPGAVDLLLTDVVLSLMAGPKLADQLRGEQPRLRVVYMPGYPDTTMAHHGVLNPGLHFLQKPFSPATLARKVRAVLGNGNRPARGEPVLPQGARP